MQSCTIHTSRGIQQIRITHRKNGIKPMKSLLASCNMKGLKESKSERSWGIESINRSVITYLHARSIREEQDQNHRHFKDTRSSRTWPDNPWIGSRRERNKSILICRRSSRRRHTRARAASCLST